MQRTLLRAARKLDVAALIPAYVVAVPDSIFAVVGIRRPRLFIGQRVLECLTAEELQAAIAHEIAHVRALDNLKQVLLRATRISRVFTDNDHALCSAAETAADARALRKQNSPLDLGAAIIKVGRLRASPALAAIAASHLVPEFASSAVRLRVEHIQSACHEQPARARERGYWWLGSVAILIAYFVKLSFWLALTHRLTEFVVG